jgi:hypothetical protein
MTVVPFVPRREVPETGEWRLEELLELSRLMRLLSGRVGAQSWETGATERGDPQFYALGPQPEQACVACVSRVGSMYVLEDGAGRVLAEDRLLPDLVRSAGRSIPRPRRVPLAARVLLATCTARAMVEEKMAFFEESAEILTRIAPPLAAFI